MSDFFRLEGRTPVPVEDVIPWARWMEGADRQVARDEVNGFVVSTVFLGLDHGFGISKVPVLFETMVFAGPRQDGHALDMDGERYSTWEEAEAGHRRWVEQVREVAP